MAEEEILFRDDLSKEERYKNLIPQLKSLFYGERDGIANLSNFMAALKSSMNHLWIGCYIVKDDELVLGPFCGPIACTRIKKGKGVCGTSWEKKQTIIVDNVEEFPGHIACSSHSKSEIVIPFIHDGEVLLVLDIDSEFLAAFDEVDAMYLTQILELLRESIVHNYGYYNLDASKEHDFTLLSEIGISIASSLSVQTVIETVYENVNKLMDASSFWVGIYNEAKARLDYPVGKERGKTLGYAKYNLTDTAYLPVWAFNNRQEIFVNDYLAEYNNYVPNSKPPIPVAGEVPQSSIWIPLYSQDKKPIGILTIQSFEKNAYNQYHKSIAKNIAVFTSIALENALQFSRAEQMIRDRTAEVVHKKELIESAYQDIKLLSEMGKVITSFLSIEKIISLLYDNVNSLMNSNVFGIGLFNESDLTLEFLGTMENGVKLDSHSYSITDNFRLAVVCFKNQKEILINDIISEYNDFVPDVKLYEPTEGGITRSIIYLPLVGKHNTILGVITVQCSERNAYTNYHVDILKNLSVYTSIAIENAKAYENLNKTSILLEEKNRNITDSISYAKRIQEAILQPVEYIRQIFPNSFMLYLPKDILSGDFYYLKNINGKLFLAVIDCTGHGVPGAMVSVVCYNALNTVISDLGINEPGKILDKINELVTETFDSSGNSMKDGMDISLVSFNLNDLIENNNRTIEAQWAGANNPLWIVKNESSISDNNHFAVNLIEIKGDKQPIGYTEDSTSSFTTHTVQLEKGDSIYLFTDGFADQFGGNKGKKFKAAQMKEMLLSIRGKNMNNQMIHIHKTFDDWKGKLEQIDDVCLVGIKL